MAFVCDIPATPTTQRDDDDVRITRWDFPPGAVTGWHTHAWPYFVILLTNAVLRVHNGSEIIDTHLVAGQAYNRVAGTQHDVMNGSDHPIAFVEIELKRPAALAG